jgi:hypothetical protein
MIEMVWNGECNAADIDFIRFEPQDAYVSIEDMKPLEVGIQSTESLLAGQMKSSFRFMMMPCYIQKVYWYSMLAVQGKSLHLFNEHKELNMTSYPFHSVYVDNNIQDKGKALQKIYLNRGIGIISVTFTGSGILVRLPPNLTSTTAKKIKLGDGDEIKINAEIGELAYQKNVPENDWSFSLKSTEWQKWRNSLIGEVIESLDVVFGLSVPIFIFGYTKMRRGISFRSNHR